MKQITITDFLTDAEIERAIALFHARDGRGMFASTLKAEIIAPNIERINKALGQENDPLYLAYMVEFVLSKTIHNHRKVR
jgi:hypothetical protein